MPTHAECPLVPFILFAGPQGEGAAEALVDGARRAAALDLLDRLAETGIFGPLMIVTPEPEALGVLPPAVRVVTTAKSNDFHFGRTLRDIVRAEGFERVMCAGAGAGPLLKTEDLLALAAPLRGTVPAVVANNLYSADIIGVTPTSALDRSDLPADDNGLAFLLWRDGGIPGHEPPRTAATQFDLDTPTDLLVAVMHPASGPRLRRYLGGQGLDMSNLQATTRVLRDRFGQIIVAGRVGSATWTYLERETACRVRLFAEERGMRAFGLEKTARSLLAMHLEAVGAQGLMRHLAELGQAVFLDSRVVLAHMRSEASREDRFLSDLGRWRDVKDPFLRDFTKAATEAGIPVILGGQNIVSGGLMALVEAAWLQGGEQ